MDSSLTFIFILIRSYVIAVLTPFKHGRMNIEVATSLSPDTFTIIGVPVATVVPARESKGDADEYQPGSGRSAHTEEKKRLSSTSSPSSTSTAPVKRKQTATHTTDRSLLIEFKDSYGRFLAHGMTIVVDISHYSFIIS
jgi:hypothetical protein